MFPSATLGLEEPGARQVALDPLLRVSRVRGTDKGDDPVAQLGVNVGHGARLKPAARPRVVQKRPVFVARPSVALCEAPFDLLVRVRVMVGCEG
jgi:hypothetical protein